VRVLAKLAPAGVTVNAAAQTGRISLGRLGLPEDVPAAASPRGSLWSIHQTVTRRRLPDHNIVPKHGLLVAGFQTNHHLLAI
jgi:hypothetical protein